MAGQGGWGGPPHGGYGGPPQGGPWQGGPQQPGGPWPQQPGPYGAPPPYGYGAPPPPRGGSTGPIIAIVVIVALVGAGAAVGLVFARARSESEVRSKAFDARLAQEDALKKEADAKEASERTQKRATLEASVRAKMAVVDRVTKALPAPSPRAVVKRVDPKPAFYGTQAAPSTNAASEPVEHDLTAPAGGTPVYHSSSLHACAAFASGKKPDISDFDLGQCDALRYVAILRTKRVEARVIGKDRFVSGTCTGDAVVFDLSSGDVVAAVPIAGRNSSEVTKYLEEASPEGYLRIDLDNACAWAAQSEINDAYEKAR